MTNRIARQVIAQCTSGRQRKELLERWWHCHSITQLDDEIVQQLIVIQLDEDSEILWKNATHLCHAYYLENKNPKPLPEDLVFRLLTAEAIADHRDLRSVSYYWSRLANAYIDQFPNRTWDLFGQLLRLSRRGSLILEDLDANPKKLGHASLRPTLTHAKTASGFPVTGYRRTGTICSPTSALGRFSIFQLKFFLIGWMKSRKNVCIG
jgi:hypothetical protein